MPSLSLPTPAGTPEAETSPDPTETPETEANPSTIYEDNNYYYARELVELSEKDYESGIIDSTPWLGITPNVTYIDEQLNLYTEFTTEDGTICELGKYSLESQEYTPLVTLTGGTIVTLTGGERYGFFLGVAEEGVVWKEVIETGRTQVTHLHWRDASGGEDLVFHSDAVDPETGRVYGDNYNPVVILGEEIYFDTITGVREDGGLEMDVLCYNTRTKETTLIANTAKRPCRCGEGIAYLRRNEDLSSALYSYSDGVETWITDFAEDVADFTLSGQTICRSLYNYDPTDKPLCISTSIYVGDAPLPLVEGKKTNYTYRIACNETAMIWEITNPEKPVYYDLAEDHFVRLAGEPTTYYASLLSQNAVLFLSRVDQKDPGSSLRYMLIRN